MLWTVLLPLTSVLTVIHTKFQINIYHGFIVFPFTVFLFKECYRLRIKESTLFASLALLAFVFFYLILGYFFNSDASTTINKLKDAKPILFLIIGFVFLDLMKGRQIDWNGKFCKKLLKFNFFATLLFFLILNYTNFAEFVSSDPFYEHSETRYLSMGTFFAVFYLLAKIASKTKFRAMEFIYIFVPIFLSGNRTFLIMIAVVLVANVLLSMNKVKSFLKKAVFFVTGGIGFFVLILFSNAALRERVFTLFNYELLIKQLKNQRFSPFFERINDFEWYNYLIGKGIGATFFIPWFEYRENIDNFNIYMDNIYMTLYMKYGLLCLVIFFLMYVFIITATKSKQYRLFIILFFLIMGLTTSFMYQSSFLFLLLILAGFKLKGKTIEGIKST